MDIEVCSSYDEISVKAKNIIIEKLCSQRALHLCAATGGSPTGLYKELAAEYIKHPGLFDRLHITKLDEWGGIDMSHPGTCETYLQKYLIQPLKIAGDRYLSFQSNPEDPKAECNKIKNELCRLGGIDICILGLGMNGHLALNEPGCVLESQCHVAQLDLQSLAHPMLGDGERPKYGLTLGMAEILQAKQIILLISGEKKKDIALKLLSSKRVTTSLPASFVWLHPNVKCLVDSEAYTVID
ncbi:galactosamine-6-phosphate isomerase [Chitinophaga sancti]|uniref:Galactosamine-6-phosphate isomerase n=2 Tax=Chitinophaga sancti TaxID=1004 RepID=A0A1K1SLG4_9BACT|nr:galactosamine-6-phosphate isomerase [Chitinophaga sancti]WQD63879.1 galactosamine-6-phosphate isomerase [Chitinophaga sancti]WQG90496.1 galactosamine-6-phosphate isomerase [Chitinophaga sancti]SFW85264.1 galactosamine-6-phosphate isomerase [Chitinophaga sancti]